VTNALLTYVINAAWQIPLTVVGALALTRIARPPAALCSRLLSGLLLVAVLLPTLPLVTWTPVPAPLPLSSALDSAAAAPALAAVSPRSQSGPSFALSQGQAFLILAAFALAISLAGLRLIAAAMMIRTWLRQSRDIVLPRDVMLHLERFAEQSRIAVPAVRLSASLTAPVVVGVFRHTIMIPEHVAALDPEVLRAVLLHECAHIARQDYAGNWACELLSLPVCWHPLLTILKRELRMARELACDQMAAAWMPSPSHYATRLLQVARSVTQQRSQRFQIAPSLIGDGQLERRIQSIIDPCVISGLRKIGAALVTGGLFVGFGTLVTVLRITPAIAHADQVRSHSGFSPAVAATGLSSASPNRNSPPAPASPPASAQSTAPRIFTSKAPRAMNRQPVASSSRLAVERSGATVERGPDGKLRVRRATSAEIAFLDKAAGRMATAKLALDHAKTAMSAAARADRSALSRAPTSISQQERQTRVVPPREVPTIVAQGNEALRVLPNGTVLFSEGPGG
jgi:beta-lactamase regulating signal transducer with metallopeptidase domain